MKVSPQRHPLAVLRTFLKIGQKEMATLIAKSTPTIQAIELGNLKISEHTALKIAQKTGVDIGWLLEGDPNAPMLNKKGNHYNISDFEKAQAEEFLPTDIEDKRLREALVEIVSVLWAAISHTKTEQDKALMIYLIKNSNDEILSRLQTFIRKDSKTIPINERRPAEKWLWEEIFPYVDKYMPPLPNAVSKGEKANSRKSHKKKKSAI